MSGNKVGFVSLGCPKALVDSERILTQLRTDGYEISPDYEGADIVVVNTCGFIDSAKAESLEAIGEALDANGRVIVTGMGKSGIVCRKIAAGLHPGLYRVFYVPLSTGNVMDMYKSIAWELGLPAEHTRASAFASSAPRSPASPWKPSNGWCSSLMRPITSEMRCWRICACSPTTRWTPRTGCACCWWD